MKKCWEIARIIDRGLAIACYLSILLALSACTPSNLPQGETVRVLEVLDDQTVRVRGEEGVETVRLLGLDIPPRQQTPWGEAAWQGLNGDLQGQTVVLESDRQTHDDGDRRWAYLWRDGQLINQEIAARGQALAVSRAPNLKHQTAIERAEDRARLLGLGIWDRDRPLRQTPTQWRSQQATVDTKTSP